MSLAYGHPFRGVRWFLHGRVSDVPGSGGVCWHALVVTFWQSGEPLGGYKSQGHELPDCTTQFFTLLSEN